MITTLGSQTWFKEGLDRACTNPLDIYIKLSKLQIKILAFFETTNGEPYGCIFFLIIETSNWSFYANYKDASSSLLAMLKQFKLSCSPVKKAVHLIILI